MALKRYGEFAGTEFAGLEFASDGVTILEADLVATGSSAAAFSGQARSNGRLGITSSPGVDLRAGAVFWTRLAGSSSSSALFNTVVGKAATFRSDSWATTSFHAQKAVPTTFAMAGTSSSNLAGIDGSAFDMRGTSGLVFNTSTLTQSGWSAAGSADVKLDSSQIRPSRLVATSASQVNLLSAKFGMGGLTINCKADASLLTRAHAHGRIDLKGEARLNLRGSARAHGVARWAGSSAVALEAAPKFLAYGTINMLGRGYADLHGSRAVPTATTLDVRAGSTASLLAQPAVNTEFAMFGAATAAFRQGSAVIRFMPMAADVVIRPEENRAAEWR